MSDQKFTGNVLESDKSAITALISKYPGGQNKIHEITVIHKRW